MQLFHPLRLSVLLGLILAMATSGVAQEAKLSALISRSPAAPNAISYVHAPSLKKLLAEANITMELSEKVQELWMVSDLDIDTLAPNWEAGYADVGDTMDADTLAKSLGGYVDIVGDKKAVWTPNESYLLPLADKGLGFLRPAKRSLLGRVGQLKRRSPHSRLFGHPGQAARTILVHDVSYQSQEFTFPRRAANACCESAILGWQGHRLTDEAIGLRPRLEPDSRTQ